MAPLLRRERQFAFEVGQIELKLLVLETWSKLMSKKKKKNEIYFVRHRWKLTLDSNFLINVISTALLFSRNNNISKKKKNVITFQTDILPTFFQEIEIIRGE